MSDQDRQKRQAAEAAAALVEPGMLIGLGSGSTAALVVEALAARLGQGLRIKGGVPTSEGTAALARRLGLPLAELDEHPLDLAIDGADEVEQGSFALLKGRGGALLREKMVATASRRLVIVVDEGKLVPRLGRGVLPVELVDFGRRATLARLAALGLNPALRQEKDGRPFRSDGGHLIADCATGPIADAAALDRALHAIPGVVETGLFLGLAPKVLVGTAEGRVLTLDS
ncbi:ribose-5-phosphate isomerase RpiA [Belnapia moabensis]|uniref:ribose-5-phosphate isomerase RpiA n=1 Tax=Belnapia moabensis TaxID=365533 RepID=UPI0005BC1D57|nr:ribose-5-phosphate isomerase RpiA [Belnapia moabensis]